MVDLQTPRSALVREPVWRDRAAITSLQPPPHWRPWLLDTGSLTSQLIAASAGHFRVQILSQTLARGLLSERQMLAMPQRSLALVREVLLWGKEQPWVFARSVLPLRSLTGPQRRWRHLDERPLGALLFTQANMRRGPIQVGRFGKGSLELPQPCGRNHKTLWGRRSVFYIDGKPLLVGEVFLPDFCPYNAPRKQREQH